MFGKKEGGLEASLRLDDARKEYLKSLRGHTPDYDKIRAAAESTLLAIHESCGVPVQYRQRIQELIEGLLISEQHRHRLVADDEIQKSVKMARNSEKSLLKSRLQKVIDELVLEY